MVAMTDIQTDERNQLAQAILERQSEMELVRNAYEDLWSDITTLVNQRRDDYLQTQAKGRKRGVDSWDGIANRALNIWADGMQGFMVSPAEVWARARLEGFEGDDEVRSWLQDYDRAMMNAFERSNFYSVIGEFIRDAGSIGTATLFTKEDMLHDRAVHTAIHPGQIYIAENNLGQVDTVHRKFMMTARQAVQEYGDSLSKELQDAAKDSPRTDYEFLHAVFPNKDRLPHKIDSINKKYRSVTLELAGKGSNSQGKVHQVSTTQIVRDGGFDELPYAVWRFRKNSDEIYGYSPAADAIMDISRSSTLNKRQLQAAHLSVEPAYNVPEEMRNAVKVLPKGYNFYRDPKRIISAVHTGINFPVSMEEMQQIRELIEDRYRVTFFLLLQNAEREMTATEVLERKSEQAALMGPQRDRLVTDGLRPVYEQVAVIEERAGRLPPPPPVVEDLILENTEDAIKVDFIGPLAQSQKMLFELQPIINWANSVGPIVAMDETTLDKFDLDGMVEDVAESLAVPQKRIRTDAEVAEIRAARAKAVAQQQQQEQLQQMAEAVPKLSKEIQPNSPLAALTGVNQNA